MEQNERRITGEEPMEQNERRIPTVDGMIVKLIRGDDERVSRYDTSEPTRSHGIWIAGAIPVGSVGTVYSVTTENGSRHWAIDFGHRFPRKQGFYHGVGDKINLDMFEVLGIR